MIKLAVIFGGKSSEHTVSIVSGTSIISNLDKKKYQIYPIYIDKEGNYYEYTKDVDKIIPLKIEDKITELKEIKNINKYLEKIDVVFPVLHGKYGEDGTIQGMLELLGKKYVGCKVLSSSLCMDKVYTKIILEKGNIPVARSMYIQKQDDKYIYIDKTFDRMVLNKEQLQNKIEEYLNYPVFIKPSREGSSVGITKVKNKKDLIEGIDYAFNYDTKVLIEETIIGREVECAVLGNNEVIASFVGEIIPAEEYYSYNSKYKNKESKTIIPADISNNLMEAIRKLAIKAYQACDCCGLARVDFFIEENTNRIILNEINTLPGFTEISMYPKLMKHLGLTYSELLDKLIELAMTNQ